MRHDPLLAFDARVVRSGAGIARTFAEATFAVTEDGRWTDIPPRAIGFPLLLTPPCGAAPVRYQGPEDVPLVDTPCPCGVPGNWLIQWEEAPECTS